MFGIELFFSNTLFGKRAYSYFLKEHPKVLEYWKIHPKNFDFNKFQKKYFTVDYIQDISANPSSNVTNKSIARFKVEMITPFIKYLTFSTLFEKMVEMYGINEATEYSKMLLDGTFYLHDTAAYIMPYCLGVDFSKLLLEGMPYGQLHSLPPKKPRTFINQVKEAVVELSSEFAGAVAFPSLIVLYTYIYLKYYGKDCKIDKKEVENDFQNLVHTLNKEMRNGIESSFTNISFFDKYILDELLTYIYSYFTNEIGDKELFLKKIQEVQKIVMEFLCKGDPITKAPYRFPVVTVNFIKDKKTGKILDREFLDLVAKNNTRGQMNIYVSDDARKYSLCCRYQPNISSFKFDSFGNGGINVGSAKVLTINLNRIALEVLEPIEEKDFVVEYRTFYLQKLKERMSIARRILDSFRECIRDFIKQGCYRFFNLGWFDLDKHFYSTIGFIGLYEALRTLDEDLRSSFAIDILETMDDMIIEFNKNGKIKYNLEQVPGESAAGLLPSLDKYFYGEEKVPYVLYSNQFVPLYERHSILDKIEIEGRYFKYLSGGGISHINILHEMKPEEVKFLIELCVEKGIEHFALNPVYSICENGHYLLGKYDECYICGAKIKDHLTRVVGFFTPVSAWNDKRREWEFSRRVWNTLKGDIESEKK